MKHLIQKIVLDIGLAERKDAYAQMESLKQDFYNNIIPKLEKEFDEIAPKGYVITIDKLEIDAGILKNENGRLSWSEDAIQQVRKQLVKSLQDNVDNDVKAAKEVIVLSKEELLKYFIEYGCFPAKAVLFDFSTADDLALSLVQENISSLQSLLSPYFFQNATRKRIVQQLPHTLKEIFKREEQIEWKEIDRLLALLKEDQIDVKKYIEWNKSTPVSIITSLQKSVLLKEYLSGVDKTISLKSDIKTVDDGELTTDVTEKQKTKTIKEEDEYYVENAGLVLFAPYLEMFFSRLGLLENGLFKNTEAQEKAVHLLQGLCTGEQDTDESKLILNKLLCGLDIHFPVKRSVDFTPQDKEQIEGLCNAVIKNWGRLGSTSVEGLRNTFIKRKGKLYKEDMDWRLVVEQSGVDILLQQIPWGFSQIKMKWNVDTLLVDWT